MYDIVHVLVFCSLLQVFRLFNEQSGELEYCLDPWLSMYLQIDYGLGTPPAIISRDLRDLKPDSSKD